MIPTREQVAAFADGQLQGVEAAEVSAAIAADASLQAQVAAHCALRDRLKGHFAPIVDQSVPQSLAALLTHSAPVVNLAKERVRRNRAARWGWIAAPALAASLIVAVAINNMPSHREGYVDTQVATALDTQLVSQQSGDAPIRVLLSFRDQAGSFCRAFVASGRGGIACHDDGGWKLHSEGSSHAVQGTEYRQAGSDVTVMQAAQNIASGPALDAVEERKAVERGWRR